MRRLWWLAIFCLMALIVPVVTLAGGGGGFDGVVDSIEVRYNAHATRIPCLWLASLVAGTATHGGVRGIHVAEFEHFSATVDGDELNSMVQQKLGPGWERMIRETSRHGGEQTLIFARPEGSRMELLIVDLDGDEMDVVQVSVDPDHLNETMGKYEHAHPERDESD